MKDKAKQLFDILPHNCIIKKDGIEIIQIPDWNKQPPHTHNVFLKLSEDNFYAHPSGKCYFYDLEDNVWKRLKSNL